MPTPISVVRQKYEAQGLPWSASDYDEIVAKYGDKIIADEPRPGVPQTLGSLTPPPAIAEPAPGHTPFRMPIPPVPWMAANWNPLGENVAAGAVRGATADIVAPDYQQVETGNKLLDWLTNKAAPTFGQFAGMGATLPILPKWAPAIGGKFGPMLARMLVGGERLGQYGAVSGAAERAREGGDLGDVALAAAKEGGKGAALGAGLSALPAFPKALGGQMGHGAALMGGLAAAQGGGPGDIAAAALAGGLTGRLGLDFSRGKAPELFVEKGSRVSKTEIPAGKETPVQAKEHQLWEQRQLSEMAQAQRRGRAELADQLHFNAELPKQTQELASEREALARELSEAARPAEAPAAEAASATPQAPFPSALQQAASSKVARRVILEATPSDLVIQKYYTPKAEKADYHDPRLVDTFRTIASRLERMSPESREIGRMLRGAVEEGEFTGPGTPTRQLQEVHINRLQDHTYESDDVGRALEGKIDPSTLSPHGQQVFKVMQDYFMSIPARARAVNFRLTSMGENGIDKEIPFPDAREDYYPQIADKPDAYKRGFRRAAAIRNARADGYFATDAEAAVNLDSWIDLMKRGVKAKNQKFAQWMVDHDQADTVEEAIGKMQMDRIDHAQNRFGPGEYVRNYDNPFRTRNVKEIAELYIKGMERRLAETKWLGQNSEKLNAVAGRIQTGEESAAVRRLVRTARQTLDAEDPVKAKFLSALRWLGSLKIVPTTTIRNFTGLNNTVMDTDAIEVVKGLGKLGQQKSRLFHVGAGATSGPTLSSMASRGKFMQRYYKWNLFSPSEIAIREGSGGAGIGYAKKMAGKLYASYQKGGVDTWARHWLHDKGIEPAAVIRQRGVLTEEQLKRASMKTAVGTQHSYHPLDLPEYMNSSSAARTVFQFKPYLIQQYRFLTKNTIDLMTKEDAFGSRHFMRGFRNLVILGVTYPMSGEVVNDIVSLIKNRKREAPLVSLRRYLENATAAGALSTLGDAMDIIQRPENLYKEGAGPAFGSAGELIQTGIKDVKKAIKGKPLTEGEKRAHVRQIPYFGSNAAYWLYPEEENSEANTVVHPIAARKVTPREVR